MRILFICQYFPPEPGAPAARTYEHARHWVEQGHEVHVVCGLPNHPDGIVPRPYRGSLLYRESLDGIKVTRCWLYATPNRGILRRSIAFFTFMLSSIFFGGFFTPSCDVVIGTSPQMLGAFGGYIISRLKRRPFVLEVRDLWPQQIVDLGAVSNPLAIRLLRWLERYLYRKAAAIVTIADAMTREIVARGIDSEKVCTVTNGIDEELFAPTAAGQDIRRQMHWNGHVVVMYIGTHGLSQGLRTVLKAAESLGERDDLRFVFAGAGAEREGLMQDARAMGLHNVEFLPMQAKRDMPAYYSAADICLVPLRKREVFLYNIPSKMFEIMACCRPIVLGAEGQARQLLDEAGAGVAVEPESPAAYVQAIQELAEQPALRRRYGMNGRRHVLAHYTRRQKASTFLACLNRVVDVPAARSVPQSEP